MPPELKLTYLPAAALLGLVFGSFFNVIIYRYRTGESIVRPPSRCPSCGTVLKVWDLIPVLSYLLLRGRCRYCGAGISPRYAVVEIVAAAVFAACLYYFDFSWLLLKYVVLFSLLLIVSGIDLELRRIPNLFVLILLAWSVLWQVVYPELPLKPAVLGLLAGGGAFLLIALVSRGGMGEGDVKLMAGLGFAAGWPQVLTVFLLSFFIGAAAGLSLMILKKKTRKSALPFGPFIAASFFITVAWGEQLWRWYLSLL